MDAIAKRMLKRDEGWRATPYMDTEGILTIGYGTNITRITKEEGEALLDIRLRNITEWDLLTLDEIDNLNEARLAVYINMLYNLGFSRFMGFKKMRTAVRAKDWNEAAIQMLDSKWAQQVGDRAVRLAQIMREGIIN